MKHKITYTIDPVVRVEIRGEKDPRGGYYIRRDDGLVSRLLQWMLAEKIYSVAGGTIGGGVYLEYHTHENAERIRAWLDANGAQPDEDA